MTSNSWNLISPFLTTRCHYQGVDLPVDLPIWALTVEASWSANRSSNTRNCHSSSLDATTRGTRSASWHGNMTSNSRNVILPFLTPRCHYQGVGLPHDLPLWALTVEMSYCHSSQLDATTGEVGLPGDVPIWALSQEILNCHSLPLNSSTRGVDLPGDLPIWALIVETSWSANMSSNSWNLILPFLATRCHYQGG